jgi:hypothetical protein
VDDRTGGAKTPSIWPFRARNVAAWTTLDLIASYTFNLPPPAAAEAPGFAKDDRKNVKVKDRQGKKRRACFRRRIQSLWMAWIVE